MKSIEELKAKVEAEKDLEELELKELEELEEELKEVERMIR